MKSSNLISIFLARKVINIKRRKFLSILLTNLLFMYIVNFRFVRILYLERNIAAIYFCANFNIFIFTKDTRAMFLFVIHKVMIPLFISVSYRHFYV